MGKRIITMVYLIPVRDRYMANQLQRQSGYDNYYYQYHKLATCIKNCVRQCNSKVPISLSDTTEPLAGHVITVMPMSHSQCNAKLNHSNRKENLFPVHKASSNNKIAMQFLSNRLFPGYFFHHNSTPCQQNFPTYTRTHVTCIPSHCELYNSPFNK